MTARPLAKDSNVSKPSPFRGRTNWKYVQCLPIAIVLTVIAAGCSLTGCDSGVPQPSLVIVTPSPVRLDVGQSMALEAVCVDCNEGGGGDPSPVNPTYSSRDTSIATVSGSVVTGVREGQTTIVAVLSDLAPGEIQVIVSEPDPPPPPVTTIETGVFTIAGLTKLEAIAPTFYADSANGPDAAGFGAYEGGGYPVSFSGAEGYVLMDLASRTPFLEQLQLNSGTGDLFGAAPMRWVSGADTSDGVLAYGASGSALFSTEGFGEFFLGNTTFDASSAGGNPALGETIVIEPTAGVRFLAPGFGSPTIGFGFRSETFSPSLFEGELVSGWLPPGGGTSNVLVLTRDLESKLYRVEGGSPVGTPLNLGLDARRIRCTTVESGTELCAVSVFGQDEVSTVHWPVGSAPSIGDTGSVSDGPVGLDLHPLSGGTFGVVSTGFNDNMMTELEISVTGEILSTHTVPVPSGCTNPGHVIYIRDSESLKVVGTCYGSNNYFVTESRF